MMHFFSLPLFTTIALLALQPVFAASPRGYADPRRPCPADKCFQNIKLNKPLANLASTLCQKYIKNTPKTSTCISTAFTTLTVTPEAITQAETGTITQTSTVTQGCGATGLRSLNTRRDYSSRGVAGDLSPPPAKRTAQPAPPYCLFLLSYRSQDYHYNNDDVHCYGWNTSKAANTVVESLWQQVRGLHTEFPVPEWQSSKYWVENETGGVGTSNKKRSGFGYVETIDLDTTTANTEYEYAFTEWAVQIPAWRLLCLQRFGDKLNLWPAPVPQQGLLQ
ncbi:hypothetical protein BST61_g3511 [Cercospora zeina]